MILSNAAGDYPGAVSLGGKLAASGPLDDAAAIALAVAYYGNNDFTNAQNLAQKAIDAEVSAGRKPDETALQIVAKSSAHPH